MSENTQVGPGPTSQSGPPAPDLDALRDEKCFPIVKGIINDLAIDMPLSADSTRGDFRPIVMKILQRTLDADCNLMMENPYIFQLLLQQLGGLKSAIMQSKHAPLDVARYGRIAKQILTIFATMDHKLGKQTPEETQTAFGPVIDQVNALFAAEKLNGLEIDYIMSNMFGAVKNVQGIFKENVEDAVVKMEAKVLGVESMTDLTMKKLDSVLQAPSL